MSGLAKYGTNRGMMLKLFLCTVDNYKQVETSVHEANLYGEFSRKREMTTG